MLIIQTLLHQCWQRQSQKNIYFKGTFYRDCTGKDKHGQGMELELQGTAQISTITCLENRKIED